MKREMNQYDLRKLEESWEKHDKLGEILDTESYTIKCHLERSHSCNQAIALLI
jgi:hypothetical protein